MPFTKHIIEPINIAQCPLPPGEPNELECLSNLTLANVIRQLSSLGQHAGRLFDELVQDAVKCQTRLQLLDARLHTLKAKCGQLDIQNEEVSVDDAKTKKQFKSSVKLDQQVVSRRTMPDSIRLLYEQADPPPALDKLNPYRTDGKDCMKFYTDPGFFFNIWCNELIKDNETRKNEKKKRKSRGDKQTPKSAAAQGAQQSSGNHNNHINNSHYADPNLAAALNQQQQQQQLAAAQQLMQQNYAYQQQQQQQQQQLIYTKSPPPAPSLPPGMAAQAGYYINNMNNNNDQEDNTINSAGLPPPPPPLNQSSVEIYAESNRLNNGMRTAKLNVQQANSTTTTTSIMGANNKPGSHYGPGAERPHLPPPPVPIANDNHLSDLQQIQQQMFNKFDVLSVSGVRPPLSNDAAQMGGNGSDIGSDLPPPPPPLHLDSNGTAGAALPLFHKMVPASNHIANFGVSSHNHDHHDDMPLPPPPPPIDMLLGGGPNGSSPNNKIATANNSTSSSSNANMNSLPPPPPLPPLVEPDTTSSSNSSLSASATGVGLTGSSSNNKSETQGTATVNRPFLDDITKGRFVLKPTQASIDERQKKTNSTPTTTTNTITTGGGGGGAPDGRDNIQPLMNNADVAAIIDFVRRRRPHVEESTTDDSDSEWDKSQ